MVGADVGCVDGAGVDVVFAVVDGNVVDVDVDVVCVAAVVVVVLVGYVLFNSRNVLKIEPAQPAFHAVDITLNLKTKKNSELMPWLNEK